MSVPIVAVSVMVFIAMQKEYRRRESVRLEIARAAAKAAASNGADSSTASSAGSDGSTKPDSSSRSGCCMRAVRLSFQPCVWMYCTYP